MTHSCRESDPDVPAARAAASLPFLAKNVRPRADPRPPPLILGKRGKGARVWAQTGDPHRVLCGIWDGLLREGGDWYQTGKPNATRTPAPVRNLPQTPPLPYPEEKALCQQGVSRLSLRGTVAAAGISFLWRDFPSRLAALNRGGPVGTSVPRCAKEFSLPLHPQTNTQRPSLPHTALLQNLKMG